jgi:hypothetical protein
MTEQIIDMAENIRISEMLLRACREARVMMASRHETVDIYILCVPSNPSRDGRLVLIPDDIEENLIERDWIALQPNPIPRGSSVNELYNRYRGIVSRLPLQMWN